MTGIVLEVGYQETAVCNTTYNTEVNNLTLKTETLTRTLRTPLKSSESRDLPEGGGDFPIYIYTVNNNFSHTTVFF